MQISGNQKDTSQKRPFKQLNNKSGNIYNT